MYTEAIQAATKEYWCQCFQDSTANYACYLLTYSMEQSPSREADRFSANQEIPRISWNTNVPYSIHTCPPPVPILSTKLSVHVRGSLCEHFVRRYFFYCKELLARCPNPKLEHHPLPAVRDCLFYIYSQLPSMLEAVPPSAT